MRTRATLEIYLKGMVAPVSACPYLPFKSDYITRLFSILILLSLHLYLIKTILNDLLHWRPLMVVPRAMYRANLGCRKGGLKRKAYHWNEAFRVPRERKQLWNLAERPVLWWQALLHWPQCDGTKAGHYQRGERGDSGNVGEMTTKKRDELERSCTQETVSITIIYSDPSLPSVQVRATRHWRIHVTSFSRRSITRPEFTQTKFQMLRIAECEAEFLWRGIYIPFYGFRSLGVSEPRHRARTNLKTLSSPQILVKCSNV